MPAGPENQIRSGKWKFRDSGNHFMMPNEQKNYPEIFGIFNNSRNILGNWGIRNILIPNPTYL
jgi:hypothetical protein